MIFKDATHKEKYHSYLYCMSKADEEHQAVAYLLAFDTNISEARLMSCFDFAKDSIRKDVLDDAWVTGSDRRILRLAFHLWNSANKVDITDLCYFDDDDKEYLLEAIRIRLGIANPLY